MGKVSKANKVSAFGDRECMFVVTKFVSLGEDWRGVHGTT